AVSPAAVRRTPRPARSRNLIPKWVSSRRICWLTAEEVMCRWRAAAPTEPVRATASKVSSAGKRAASIMKPILTFGVKRFTGLHSSRRASTSDPTPLSSREEVLPEDSVHAPVAVHDLGDSEVHGHRHERDGLVLAEPPGGHEEVPHLAEGIAHGQVDRRLLIDPALGIGTELGQLVGVAEAVHDPLVLRLEERIDQAPQRGT